MVSQPAKINMFAKASGYVKPSGTAKEKRYKIITFIFVSIIFLIVIVFVISSNIFGPSGGKDKVTWSSNFEMVDQYGASYVLDSAGTVFTISSGSYTYQLFWTNLPITLSGTFSSTGGVTAYIVDSSQWNATSNYNANSVSQSQVGSYYYTTGDVITGSINTNLAAGSYYLVIFTQ
jgi:hypothetical protein